MTRYAFTRRRAFKLLLAAALLSLAEPNGAPRAGANRPAAQEQQQQHGGKIFPVRGGPVGADEKLASAGIYLLPEGFAPGALEVPAGPVLLSIKKRVGVMNVDLELRAEGRDDVIWRAAMPEQVSRWSEIVRLRPGKYTLSAAGRPEWVCRIAAEPRGRS